MTVSFLVLLLSVLTPLLAAGADVPIVTNPSSPANGLETLQLEEMWRVGGIEDEDTVLGQIVRIVGDASGNIYVLDAQLQQALSIMKRVSCSIPFLVLEKDRGKFAEPVT